MSEEEEWERNKESEREIKRNDGRDRYRWGETKRRLGRETSVRERRKDDIEKDKKKGRRTDSERETQGER